MPPSLSDESFSGFLPRCIHIDCKDRHAGGGIISNYPDVLSLSLAIQQCRTWDELVEIAVSGLSSFLGAVESRWLEVSSEGGKILWSKSASDEHEEYGRRNLEGMILRSSELGVYHDQVELLLRGESDEVCRLSDHLSQEERSSNMYIKDVLKPMGVCDVLMVQLFCSADGAVILSLGMPEGEVSEGDMENLKFIQSHMRLACFHLSRVASYSNMTGALMDLHKGERKVGVSVVSCDGKKLRDSDAVSKKIMRDMRGGEMVEPDGLIPEPLAGWVQATMEKHTRICACVARFERVFKTSCGSVDVGLLLERVGSGAVLVFKREDRADGCDYGGIFTKRELDVIRYIGDGLPSQEASDLLCISKRTVDKHLENIYIKLEVNNRLSAVRRLGEIKDGI